MDADLSDALAWYVFLASDPAWKAQSWHSANALAQQFPGVFADLPQLLTERMRKETADAAA